MNVSKKTLGAGALLLLLAGGLATWANFRPSPAPQADGRTTPAAIPSKTTETRPARPAAPAAADLPPPQLSPFASDSPEHVTWIKERREVLLDLSWMDDKESLDTILTELWNPDPKIRQAALEATLNFGSRDAIPKLQAAALLRDEDSIERKKLEDAAEYLKLPTLIEHIAKKREDKAKEER